MNKLFELLGVNKLDESQQSEFKERFDTLVEARVAEKVNEKLESEKEQLVEQFEMKFEEYKEDITSKFSNFVDSVLEEEMQIPDKVYEYARKGELYADLIEQFKIRLGIDEGVLDEEARSLLKEAKDEIIKLRSQLDEKYEETMTLSEDAKELATALYLRMKCEGLTESQKDYVISVLEDEKDREVIDRKFDIILESMDLYEEDDMEDEDDEDEDEDKKKKKKKDKKDGKGSSEVESDDEEDDGMNETWKQHKQNWIRILNS